MSPLFAGAIVFIGLVTFASTMYWRLGAMAALKSEPGNRLDRLGERIGALMKFGFGQRRMLDPEEFLRGLMHFLIFAAFLATVLQSGLNILKAGVPWAYEVLPNMAHPFWAEHAALKHLYEAYLPVKDVT